VVTIVIVLLGFWLLSWIAGQYRFRKWRSLMLWAGGLLILGIAAVWWKQLGYLHLAIDVFDHMMLPMGSVILLSFGETMLLMRTTMLETIEDEYVLTARAKGLSEQVVRDRHVARNAFLPVLSRLLLNLPLVLTGSLAIELVFRWQAMGELIFVAIDFQDIPLLLGILSIVGVLALVGHIILDILHVYLDPRLRYNERSIS